MNIITWLKKKNTTIDIYNSILKMPCATDGKSFIYLSLPLKFQKTYKIPLIFTEGRPCNERFFDNLRKT